MLKRLRVDNFKSLINLVFEPGQVNLLIGRNNSGKTNLCQAMRFLCATSFSPLSEAASFANVEPWNLTNAYLNKDVVTFECLCELGGLTYDYSLTFNALLAPHLGYMAREYFVVEEYLKVSGERFPSETVLLENRGGQVRLLNEARFASQSADSYAETTAPTNATMLSRLYDLQNNRSANQFKEYLGGWQYYDLDPARLRSPQVSGSGLVLNQDGSNLSHVLFQVKSLEEQWYRRFVEVVREVEPKLDALNFAPPTQESVFMVFTDKQNRRFSVNAISNGTLRYMALAYILMMMPAMAEAGHVSPFILVEEPENGLYVGCLKKLMELLEPANEFAPQFIFTSHSPYFIDLFDRYLDDVFLMKSDGTHSEIVRPGSNKLNRILDSFPLGEAHYRELIG